jgi:AhpD family alkylhydroperoxidase
MRGFRKRVYTARAFARDLRDVLTHLPSFRDTARSGRVSRSFAEKIMLAVTEVNGCRYCAYGHTRTALRAGVAPQEIAQILAGDLDGFPEEEAVALAFAQHWAETAGHPDPDAERRFRSYYGPQASTDILNWMRMINMGNLMGNTFDAILYRLGINRPAAGPETGRPRPDAR